MRIADEYLDSQRTLDDKLYFFYQFDQIAQDIPSERIEVLEMDVLDGIRQDWIAGQAMDYNKISLAQDYYGNTVSWLMNGVAKVGGWLHLPLNPERLRKLTENYISSNEKIKKALGVEKMPVDARTGLQRTLDSFKR